MKYISQFLLWIFGWTYEGTIPDSRRFIVVSAPHTSMWDFVVGRLFYFSKGIKAGVMIKKELFFFPLGIVLRAIGGIPVERNKKSDIVDQMVDLFRKNDEMVLTITPEGTRKKTPRWKKGFYHIATKAGVPVLPGYFDYKRKVIGIGEFIYPSGDIEKDMRTIKLFFKDITPRHPEKFTIGNI